MLLLQATSSAIHIRSTEFFRVARYKNCTAKEGLVQLSGADSVIIVIT